MSSTASLASLLAFRLAERQRRGPYRQRSSPLPYGQRARRADRRYDRWNNCRGECGSQNSACCGSLWPQNNLTQTIAVCSLRLPTTPRPETRTESSIGGRLESPNVPYVVKTALRGTDGETELSAWCGAISSA